MPMQYDSLSLSEFQEQQGEEERDGDTDVEAFLNDMWLHKAPSLWTEEEEKRETAETAKTSEVLPMKRKSTASKKFVPKQGNAIRPSKKIALEAPPPPPILTIKHEAPTPQYNKDSPFDYMVTCHLECSGHSLVHHAPLCVTLMVSFVEADGNRTHLQPTVIYFNDAASSGAGGVTWRHSELSGYLQTENGRTRLASLLEACTQRSRCTMTEWLHHVRYWFEKQTMLLSMRGTPRLARFLVPDGSYHPFWLDHLFRKKFNLSLHAILFGFEPSTNNKLSHLKNIVSASNRPLGSEFCKMKPGAISRIKYDDCANYWNRLPATPQAVVQETAAAYLSRHQAEFTPLSAPLPPPLPPVLSEPMQVRVETISLEEFIGSITTAVATVPEETPVMPSLEDHSELT